MSSIALRPMNNQPITKIVCEIPLQVLADATIESTDETIRAKAQQFISAAYALRSEIAEFAATLESDTLAALESRHQALLVRRDEIIAAQAALVTDRGLIDNNRRREDLAL